MACEHKDMVKVKDVKPGSVGCEECLKSGGSWVHLRICLTCGHVGCCNQSKNKHATKHFKETGHPIIQSFQPGEDWKYCYIDGEYLE
ncbi:UBP-type zinc finger domain-containing protein [Methanosarcina sp. KYL-1]|uniref:UBP-type zinc finger domain-containing protein n=1 Tax=Methanosarcina sp. KYL-1 TaxID=2602068 RepID=UPI002101C680|nr:UBP-type zinc finger domain-containing protein [Methanosarcina sp. KYL-1]MCQ1535384.1 UBP-type zinc finger domain-containing protein [Methanosarcina sp. KYL-1]